jgi:signal peptide peptidase SppA
MWRHDVMSALGLREYRPVVAVVRLAGIISAARMPLRRGDLNMATLAQPLERAFKLPHLRAVALQVNSPGGSPVQSALIHRRVRQLAAEHAMPVFAFAEDVAASGGYWLACAADEIYAEENSIIGSIGVISASFGLQDLIARYGIERRVHTAGEKKLMLDPFMPEKTEDVERLKAIQTEIHSSFKALVRDRRSHKLNGDEGDLFSGDVWTGRRAKELGLVDGLGDLRTVMRDRYGEKVRLVAVGDRGGWLRRRFGLTAPAAPAAAPMMWGEALLAAIEARLMWGRFGL